MYRLVAFLIGLVVVLSILGVVYSLGTMLAHDKGVGDTLMAGVLVILGIIVVSMVVAMIYWVGDFLMECTFWWRKDR